MLLFTSFIKFNFKKNLQVQYRYYNIYLSLFENCVLTISLKYFQYNRIINDMLAVYNSAEICAYNEPFKCGLHLQPELQFIMSHSRDWDELQHVWTEWRRNTGRRIRDLYEQLIDLTNQAARLNSKYSSTQLHC